MLYDLPPNSYSMKQLQFLYRTLGGEPVLQSLGLESKNTATFKENEKQN